MVRIHSHPADALVDVRVRRQRFKLFGGQFQEADITLFGGDGCFHNVDFALGLDGLGFDFVDELSRLRCQFKLLLENRNCSICTF